MPIKYPPGFISTLGNRSEDEILAELDRRCGYLQGEVRSIPLDQAAPAPDGKDSKPSYDIHVPRAMRAGLKGGCGKNAKAK